MTQKQATRKSTKVVLILARYFNKVSGTVYCKVRNGENKEYCVALHKNGHTTCTCKHGQQTGNHAHCYHVQHCQEKEMARQSVATSEEVAARAEVKAEAKMATFKSGMEAQYGSDPRPMHVAERQAAPLAGASRGFRMMR